MAVAIRLRRGVKSQLPSEAYLGEALVTTDTGELYVGMGLGQPLKRVVGISVSNEDLTSQADGTRLTFTVVNGYYVPGSLKVYLDAIRQRPGSGNAFTESSPSTGQFTWTGAPRSGGVVLVDYQI